MNTETHDTVAAKVAQAWRADHAAFKRLLDLLDHEVVAFHTGGEPNYLLMLDILQYLHDYGDRSHHPREDVAFALLAQRELAMQLHVARRAQEHRIIAVAALRLIEQLNAVLGGDLVARAEVELTAATYLVYYRHHLNAEEEVVIPRAIKLFTDADWATVAAAGAAAVDPLSPSGVDAGYAKFRRALASG